MVFEEILFWGPPLLSATHRAIIPHLFLLKRCMYGIMAHHTCIHSIYNVRQNWEGQVWSHSFPSYWGKHFETLRNSKLGAVALTCNPSTQEAEVGGSWIWGHPGQHSETLPQKNPKPKKQTNKKTNQPTKIPELWEILKSMKMLHEYYLVSILIYLKK
jgi:hypothetical protein